MTIQVCVLQCKCGFIKLTHSFVGPCRIIRNLKQAVHSYEVISETEGRIKGVKATVLQRNRDTTESR